MKRLFLFLLLIVLPVAGSACFADASEDSRVFDQWLAEANRQFDSIRYSNAEKIGSPLPQESWDYNSGLVFVLYNIFDGQTENSLEAAGTGVDFHGIPNAWLAKDLASAEKVILLQQVSESSSSKAGTEYSVYAKLILVDPRTGAILDYSFTPSVYLTKAEKEAFNLMGVDSCVEFLGDYAEKHSHPDGYKEKYDAAMALYNDERYYSARREFIASAYGDWEEMAAKCLLQSPATGELWHDPSLWVRDMYLTFRIDQPEDTSIFIRLYKDGKPVSYLFISGPGETTAELPGNGYYTIKDGIGTTWYGMKEAFGPDGSYETMTFDETGAEEVYLQSYYEYTISINVESGGPGIGSKEEDWDSFAE